jgi:hypothetical protein
MADAAGSTVLDASYPFEDDLLKTWADARRSEVSLVYVDREDDPDVFREIDPSQDRAISQLAQEMSAYIRPGGTGRLRVEARRFEPASLTAVLQISEAGAGSMKARNILNDPNAPSDLRAMAEEMIRLSRNADMRMSINASNSLVRTLATLIEETPDDPDLTDLMLGIYNDAILYNQELMTPSNAQIFHEQFQRLMGRSVEFVRQRAELAREREALERQRQAHQPKKDGAARTRKHLIAFLMAPFSEEFQTAREAVRIAVEDKLGCELRLAKDKTFEDFIRGNVKAHMDDADFFIADVTGANPNVMMELGAAYDGQPGKPALLIARVAGPGGKPDLPADLAGQIAVTYLHGVDAVGVAVELESAFRRHTRLETLIRRQGRESFVSAESLRTWTRNLLSTGNIYERLNALYPTVSAWRGAKAADIEKAMGCESDLVDVLLKRVRENLPT